MKKIDLKQNSQKWLDYKKSRIGSSEIFGLVEYYSTRSELINAGIDPDKFDEQPYTTAYQLFHKIKNPHLYIEPEFDPDLADFGHRIEDFAIEYLNKEKKYNATYKKGEVFADKVKIASLDIQGKAESSQIIQDSNGFNISLADIPDFIVEAKAISLFKSKKDNITTLGVDWKFIFQLQYQLYCSGLKWGKIIVVTLNKDRQHLRGYICGLPKSKYFDYIKNNSKINEFIYIARPEYFYLIQNALEKFEFDLRTNNEPEFPNYKKVFDKNHNFFYNLVLQKGQILGTADQIIESDQFDSYFKIKEEEKKFKEKTNNIHQNIRKLMLDSGKACIKGKAGKISINKKDMRGYKNKEEEGSFDYDLAEAKIFTEDENTNFDKI